MGLRIIKPVVARPPKHHCSQQARNLLRRASLLLSFSFALAGQVSPPAMVLLRLPASNYHAAASS